MQYQTVAKLRKRAAIRQRSPRRGFRDCLRVSVTALMVLVAAIAGALGWFAHCARLERTAALAIFRAGGSFDSSAQPGRLTRLLGSGHFEHVASICGGPRFNDDVYAQIGRLRQVQTLITYPATVTDAGMAHLRRLTGLRKLQVTTRRASAASVANLAGMTRLGTLRLHGIPVADEGLDALAGMAELRELVLDSPRITDAGVARLSRLSRLRELDLSGTRVTDAGLTHLLGLTELETLTVRRTAVTAVGIARLRRARPGLEVIR